MRSPVAALLRGARLPSVTMLLSLAALCAIGVLYIHSATTAGEVPFPGPQARAQLLRMAVGLGFLVLFLRLDYRRLEEWAGLLYAAGIGLLLLLIALKLWRTVPSRWLHLPGFALQPSELMKIFTVLLLARTLKPIGRRTDRYRTLWPWLVGGVPTLLVMLQPDLGTALVLPPVLLAMLWTSGMPARSLVALCLTGAALLPLGWWGLHDYQKSRILVFLEPDNPAHARVGGYQLRQSIIALGSGGWTGRGLYEGTQNRLDYLPEDHNDFIFSIIGEEWGLVGTLGVLALFLFLYLSCLKIAYRTREPYGRLVVVGLCTYLAFQTLVNLAMTMGLAPVTGLPLPFVSYGGSSLLTSLAAAGIILGVGMRPVRIVSPDGLRSGRSPVVHGRSEARTGAP